MWKCAWKSKKKMPKKIIEAKPDDFQHFIVEKL